MRTTDLLRRSADTAIKRFGNESHAPAGSNGPWNDEDTPVRNTAHWGITFAWAAKQIGDRKYRDAARMCATYLCSDEVQPEGYSYRHRQSDEKDQCNGLIGQAWTIESLIRLGKLLDNPKLLDIAESLIETHPYDGSLPGWHAIDVDGTDLGYHFTLNQQLWFAAVGAEVCDRRENDRIERQVQAVLDRVPSILTQFREGPVYHSVAPGLDPKLFVPYLVKNIRLKRIPDPILHRVRTEYRRKIERRSYGYHSFILSSLAILHEQYPNHPTWEDPLIETLTEYTRSERYRVAINDNQFCYSYNPTGFEIAHWEWELHENKHAAEDWVSEQLSRCYSFDRDRMDRTPYDEETLAARIYQLTRLPELTITVDQHER
ncbi:hypothetical protein [Natronorubrum sp. FCH18a]|uniref:hypothetical protein n=1 Tax=Natronorubrum sp. FCH18a TaxID=3447018 RepID=UPI003F512C58